MSQKPKNQGKSGKPKFQVSGPYRDEKGGEERRQGAAQRKRKEGEITAIESDEDFERYNLDEWDISEIDKLPDNRVSGFWKMSWLEVFLRAILFVGIVIVNEKGWANPHSDNFVLAPWEFRRLTWDPFPPEGPEFDTYEPITLWGLIEYDKWADNF